MKNRRLINSTFLLYKKNRLNSHYFSSESANYSSSRRRLKHLDKLTRPSSSSSIFSQRLNFLNESKQNKNKDNNNNNLNVLDLIIENNPNKYNYQQIKKKVNQIEHFYGKENFKPNNRVKEVFYKYNVLYGQNASNIIRTYSPKMRPMSSSVNKFVKKMNNDQKDNLPVFSQNEINQLIKTKCNDIGIDVKEHMMAKFKDYCNSKCKNRTVDLTENFLGLNSIKFISDILYNTDRIAKLNLSKNNLGDIGIQILVNAIKDSNSLITLNVSSNGITYIGGEIVFKNFINQQSIIDFNIATIEGSNRNRNRLTFSGIKDIISFLKQNHFVEYFNLSGNSIKNEGFIAICKGLNENKSLSKLKLAYNEIGERGIIQGLKYITNPNKKLVHLDLSKNRILDEGLMALANQLKDFPGLMSLNLSFCGFEFRGFEFLLKSLQYSRKIEVLNISGNKLRDENFDQVKNYFNHIGLKTLNMSKCSLGDDSTFKLGECMEVNFSIRKLNISENEISDKGFESFANLFYKNSVITNFDCSSNFITNDGIKNLIKSLEVNNSLNSLNLYDNQLQIDIGNLILEVLQKNKTLLYINLFYNRIPMAKIDEINRFIKSNADNLKQKFIPNLIRSVKQLEFNPNQFDILTSKIKSKKIDRDILYKKVKEEDNIYSSIIQEQQKDIDIKMSESNNISVQVKQLVGKIYDLEKLILKEDKNYKEQEAKFKEKISREENYLSEALKDKATQEKEYKLVEMDNDNIYNLTKEKLKLSEIGLQKLSYSLKLLTDNYNKKNEELNKLMSIKNSRYIRKRAVSTKKTMMVSKRKSGNHNPGTLRPLRSSARLSVFTKREENKQISLFNLKENENEEIKEIKEEEDGGVKRNKNNRKSKMFIEDKNKKKNNNDIIDAKINKNFTKSESPIKNTNI